jgi:pyruvate kinase
MAFTTNPRVRNQLSLLWGTEAFLVAAVTHTDDMVRQVDRTLLELDRFQQNDRLVFIAGVPPGVPGTTNGMRVHKLGRGANNTQ